MSDPTLPRTPKTDAAFDAWWPRHAAKHNSRSPVAAREAFTAGWSAAVANGNAERELIYDDLGKLADLLGLGSHARPYPARQLFGECLAELAAFGDRKVTGIRAWADQIRSLDITDPVPDDDYERGYRAAVRDVLRLLGERKP